MRPDSSPNDPQEPLSKKQQEQQQELSWMIAATRQRIHRMLERIRHVEKSDSSGSGDKR
ncbi:MAG: hypothetical protein JWO91_3033 [Acidobacteriaceae bacterium]|nr:hypothetical protein [Acidobacteriaceae bacterium]